MISVMLRQYIKNFGDRRFQHRMRDLVFGGHPSAVRIVGILESSASSVRLLQCLPWLLSEVVERKCRIGVDIDHNSDKKYERRDQNRSLMGHHYCVQVSAQESGEEVSACFLKTSSVSIVLVQCITIVLLSEWVGRRAHR